VRGKVKKLFRLGVLLLILVAVLLPATPVYADTPDPDDTPQIESINIYRNAREVGDMFLMIYANIPYATIPDQPVTETFIWSLIDTDNVTELGSTIGYAYNIGAHQTDGYGYNVYSMYFDADNVTALGMTWLDPFIIRLAGNPAVFDTPPIYNYDVNIADYSALTVKADVQAELAARIITIAAELVTVKADVQAELAARIITIAAELDTRWGQGTSYSLIEEYEAGTALSLYGEAFFRGAIFGLQNLAPGVFSVIIRSIDIDPREWDPEYSENVTSQWDGTWIQTAREAGQVLFGTTYDLLSVIMLLVMSVGLLIGNISITGDHWNGLVDVAVIGVIGARLGMYDFAFLMLVAALCWIYIGTKVWFGLIK